MIEEILVGPCSECKSLGPCNCGNKQFGALRVQVGGSHYKDCKIQPIEYIHGNGLDFIEGSVVKYITRWRSKGGIDDLKKIKHYIDLLIELEAKDKP